MEIEPAGWEMREQEEREQRLDEALRECISRGLSEEALKVLIQETGARWHQ